MTEIAKAIDMQTGEEWVKKRKREGLVLDAAVAAAIDHIGNEDDDNDGGIDGEVPMDFYEDAEEDYGDENEDEGSRV